METKICSFKNCVHNGELQPLTNFSKCKAFKSGYMAHCKDCHIEYYKKDNPNHKKRDLTLLHEGLKICADPECTNPGPKPLSEFYKQNDNLSGVRSRCKECTVRDRKRNREKYLIYERQYLEDRPGYNNYKASQYRSALLQATPKWANIEKIKEIYRKCFELNKLNDNNDLVVDHIIPLRGKNVCGLHVETNLQIISFSENSKKSNKFSLVLEDLN